MHRDWTEQMARDDWGEAWDNAHHDEPGQPWDRERWAEPTQLHPSAPPEAPSAARAHTPDPEPVPVAALIIPPARRTREPAPPPAPVDREKGLRLYLADTLQRLGKP